MGKHSKLTQTEMLLPHVYPCKDIEYNTISEFK